MNELSLFTGAGGGLLGTLLLGFKHIGYVEIDDYCQRVIAARIKDGILDNAPIFGDIKTFISDGYAASYTGMVDVITAGFPCQPFSVAGKQKGADDERNMWPATSTVIGIVKPRFVLLENVPGVRTYLPVVVRDLRRLGYEVSRPLILGADDVGAPHRRKRVWIVANMLGIRRAAGRPSMSGQEGGATLPCNADWEITDGLLPGSQGRGELGEPEVERTTEAGSGQSAPGCDRGWKEPWPEVAARLCRVDDGVAHRVDRLKALGNGQVPLCVATAWRILTDEMQTKRL